MEPSDLARRGSHYSMGSLGSYEAPISIIQGIKKIGLSKKEKAFFLAQHIKQTQNKKDLFSQYVKDKLISS